MTIDTRIGIPVEADLIAGYFHNLVNMFFKILPMKENGETTLDIYMESMLSELMGGQRFIVGFGDDALFCSLLFILQGLIDHPEWSSKRVKREVFRAISICNKIKSRYGGGGRE